MILLSNSNLKHSLYSFVIIYTCSFFYNIKITKLEMSKVLRFTKRYAGYLLQIMRKDEAYNKFIFILNIRVSWNCIKLSNPRSSEFILGTFWHHCITKILITPQFVPILILFTELECFSHCTQFKAISVFCGQLCWNVHF